MLIIQNVRRKWKAKRSKNKRGSKKKNENKKKTYHRNHQLIETEMYHEEDTVWPLFYNTIKYYSTKYENILYSYLGGLEWNNREVDDEKFQNWNNTKVKVTSIVN